MLKGFSFPSYPGEDSKTLMLVHVSPREEDLCETICSLSFATRVKSIHLGDEESTVSKYKMLVFKITIHFLVLKTTDT